MLLAGDEFRRTQGGNNNAYCQDDEITWTDWSLLEQNAELVRFVQELTALRHRYPILHRTRFLTGAYDEALDVKDVTWIAPSGDEIAPDAWGEGRTFGMLVDGRAQPTGIHKRGEDATLLIVFNAHFEDVPFTLPHATGGECWTRRIDTAIAGEGDAHSAKPGDVYDLHARSLALFELESTA
jgi:glycogen operon protein